MDFHTLSLPDWLPWWGVVGLLVPVALYLALFLLMPFSTFGLRGRLNELEMRLDAVHEEVRSLTLRLPDRGGLDRYDELADLDQPPIPPMPREAHLREGGPPGGGRHGGGPRGGGQDRGQDGGPARAGGGRGGFGDPVADKMLAYMREKAQSDLQRAEQPRPAPRPRAEPRFTPPLDDQGFREPFDLPPAPPVGPLLGPGGVDLPGQPSEHEFPPDAAMPPRPPRVPGRFGRRSSEGDQG
jgi:hypothetical protein